MTTAAGATFLWGGATARPDPQSFAPREDRWWNQYRGGLTIAPAAIRELSLSSRHIVGLLPDPLNWNGAPSPFKGLVVGAVQSGKTASMVGVAAVALDHGYRVVIVLAGTKDDLREQTARRFNTQLLRQSDRIPDTDATTLGTAPGKGPLRGFALPYTKDANKFAHLQLRLDQALCAGEPCVLVVKKNVVTLRDVCEVLHWAYYQYGTGSLPTLILDDECDDASVDTNETAIPASITNLWRRDPSPHVVYLGYTATAAANLLQDIDQDLHPSQFVTLLKYPSDAETALSFEEPEPDRWYAGSHTFYKAFGDEPSESSGFLVSATVSSSDLAGPIHDNESLWDALRAYFVAGAMRLVLQKGWSFDVPERYPLPHSMLVQTSQVTQEHRRWGKALSDMLGGQSLPDRSVRFDPDVLRALLDAAPDLWQSWFLRYEASRERVYLDRPHAGVEAALSWKAVREALPSVFNATKLKIVNSDAESGTGLDFAPRATPTGQRLVPQDGYVIVVGGSKLSRGLTVEGLCTTYFVRWTTNPKEDTITQLSRWFGYRGTHLEFCRIFTSPSIYAELVGMSDNDSELKAQLARLMAERRSPAEAVFVIRSNPRALPTAKMGVGTLKDIAFSPFCSVFPHIEMGNLAEANEQTAAKLVARIRSRDALVVRTSTGRERGLLSRGWHASEVANVLDSLLFSAHNPDTERKVMREQYREADYSRATCTAFRATDDPYEVAAYLRAWLAAAGEGRNVVPPPLFNLAVSFGDMAMNTAPFDIPLANRMITEDGIAVGGWTGRSTGWAGDAFFDDPPPQLRMPNSYSRAAGADGLLLMYVIHKEARGRGMGGRARRHHTPLFGISIPGGGPPFRRTLWMAGNEDDR